MIADVGFFKKTILNIHLKQLDVPFCRNQYAVAAHLLINHPVSGVGMDLDLGKEEWGFLTCFRSCRVSQLLSVLSGSQGSHPLAGRVLLAALGLGTSSRAGRLLPVGAATLH